MSYIVEFEGIIFDEGSRNDVSIIKQVEVDLSFKIGAQLKSLRDVKTELVNKAKKLNANCIMNFTYGQKSKLFAIDDVAYYGKGIACNLDNNMYQILIEKIRNR